MASVIVRVAGLFGLMVSGPKTEIMCLLPKVMEECPFTVSAGDQTYKQTDLSFCLGQTITADGEVDKEVVEHGSAFAATANRCTTGGASTSVSRCNYSRPKRWRRSGTDAPHGV